ncbi:MAG TPA: hypothetical protein VMM76_12635 [Pirellulaceae bacterium]|nr:hypothetical protein [Pirellulaceae bacterium]
MTKLGLNSIDAYRVACRVNDHLIPHEHRLKPHDRFNNTLWWIIPTPAESPSYKYGKYVFERRDHVACPGTIFCGLHVEKGYGDAASGIVSRNELSQGHWMWHRLLADVSSGFPNSIARATVAIETEVHLHIAASMSPQPRKPRVFETIAFATNGANTVQLSESRHSNVLDGFQGCTTWNALVVALRSIRPELEPWYWIDFEIGYPFTETKDDPDHIERCVKMLQAFRPWFD